MRILYLGTDRGLLTDGSAVSMRHARMGEAYPKDTFTSIVFSTRAHRVLDEHAISPNVHAYATQSSSRLLYGYDAMRIAKSLPRPDIVTAQDPFETGLAARMISRHFNVPFAVEVHTDILASGYRTHSFLNRIRLWIAGYVLPRAAGGYAVSASLRDALVREYHLTVPFEVIPIYVDTRRFSELPRTPEPGHLLWVGRFEPEKRPDRALTALAAARSAGLEVHLTMLGEGSLRAALVARAQEIGVAGYVTFAGWQDTAAYLPRAELLLSTSSYEGYGMAVIEALSAGVPVLATDTGIARAAGAGIAEGSYAGSLISWLRGPRARGVLTLKTYADEREYISTAHALYATLVSKRKRILIITQAVNLDDPVLGFFHSWIEGLSAHFESVHVICLYEGRHALPENVQAYSLGKEQGRVGKVAYVLRFYQLLRKLRGTYDTVFVHMNEEYVLLGGLYWRLKGIRTSLWRNFYIGSWRTRLAVALASRVFCTSRDSFTAQFKKTHLMPVGADTEAFTKPMGVARVPRSILMLGRIAPVKRVDVLLKALAILKKQNIPFSAGVYGNALPNDTEYLDSLHSFVREEGFAEQVQFHPGIAHRDAPPVFQAYDIFVNVSPSGLYDKTIFEAAAAGAIPMTSNRDYALEADPQLVASDINPALLATQLAHVLDLPADEKDRLRAASRALAATHTLPSLIEALSREL